MLHFVLHRNALLLWAGQARFSASRGIKMKVRRGCAGAAMIAACVAGCTDIQTTMDRSALLNSPGPVIEDSEVDKFLTGIETVRKFYAQTASFDEASVLTLPRTNAPENTQAGGASQSQPFLVHRINQKRLFDARTLMLAYVDARCDAYLDAIYWANRTQSGIASGNNALATATETILGTTGASSRVLTVVAAAFGLSGSLFDSYYEAVLNGLEPSSVRNIVDRAQIAVRSKLPQTVSSEAEVLQQVQDYIRQCTPANIKFLVDSALKKTNVKPEETGDNSAAIRTSADNSPTDN
ncbi:MAG: hypothetical protein AAF439_00330 [Pseudomonadota bacterium]